MSSWLLAASLGLVGIVVAQAAPSAIVGLSTAGICLACLVGLLVHQVWWLSYTSPLRDLPGPKSSYLDGFAHLRAVLDAENSTSTLQDWYTTYGPVIKFKGFFGVHDRLMIFDPAAIKEVLANGQVFEKPLLLKKLLGEIMGHGLIIISGPRLKLQRKVLQPFFSASALKGMWPHVTEIANELADVWDAELTVSGKEKDSEWTPLDVVEGIDKATFDIIGLTGFDHSFHSLRGYTDELYTAFKAMLGEDGFGTLRQTIGVTFPLINRIFPTQAVKAQQVIRRLGTDLIASRKLALLSQDSPDLDLDSVSPSSSATMAGKDLVSLMVKNALSPSLDPSQRMTDEEIFSQISTFIFAGQDTVSTSVSCLLHHLSLHPHVQALLRSTLATLGPEPTLAEVDACEYLDAVVKETLRLSPALQSTYRVAQVDAVLPLREAVLLKTGEKVREVRVRKGQLVHVPTESLNTLTQIWGEDATEFKPERWLHSLLPSTEQNPGLFAKTMTFLDGPRSCIGFRLALAEMKAITFSLITRFEFAPDPSVKIGRMNFVTTRPCIAWQAKDNTKDYPTSALPLLVRRVKN